MNKKAALFVGVDKTGDLTPLRGASAGAIKFGKWAASEGFDVEVITDLKGGPVRISDLKDAIKKFVTAKIYSQLVVYFAGHGILRGPDYELWLLSDAPDDPNEAVTVPLSIFHARNCGIPHVVFISDACRSTPATPRLNSVMGSSIFPNISPMTPRPEVDMFYATLPGDPAYEVPAAEAVKNYRGLFTHCLLEALTNRPAEIMEQRPVPTPQCWVVPAWRMRNFLEKEVPDAAAAVSIRLVQTPEIRVESHLPNCLLECPTYTPPKGGIGLFPPPQVRAPSSVSLLDEIDKLPDDPTLGTGKEPQDKGPSVLARPGLQEAARKLIKARGRESFETRTGFTILGTRVMRATAGRVKVDIFEENSAQQVRVHWNEQPQRGGSLLLQFQEGIATIVAIIPGYIGTIVVDRNRVVNISYLPSRDNDSYLDYQLRADDIHKRHAYIAAAARQGVFKIEASHAETMADYLRSFKSIDPTLGLYSAYAYVQAGAIDAAKSVYGYMLSSNQPVLFDVALLAGELPAASNLIGMRAIAPLCPMLTQGWAMLGTRDESLPASVRKARQYLSPSLWTTFAPEAVEILWQEVEKGMLNEPITDSRTSTAS
jgi:hypothetical protein